jgi:hypothetical protein
MHLRSSAPIHDISRIWARGDSLVGPIHLCWSPLLADAHVNGTDPFRILCYFSLPFVPAYNWNLILKSILTGLRMFMLLRHLQFARSISVPLGLTYQFAGCFAFFFGHPVFRLHFCTTHFSGSYGRSRQNDFSFVARASARRCVASFSIPEIFSRRSTCRSLPFACWPATVRLSKLGVASSARSYFLVSWGRPWRLHCYSRSSNFT